MVNVGHVQQERIQKLVPLIVQIVQQERIHLGGVLLEDVAVCMSKCASNVANGTGVMSGVSWVPDGVSLISLIHQE